MSSLSLRSARIDRKPPISTRIAASFATSLTSRSTSPYLFAIGPPPFYFSVLLKLLDKLELLLQSITKPSEHVDEQIDLCDADSPGSFSSKKKFELHPAATVSNRDYVVAPFVFPVI
jgi:hypothetical protein